MQVVRVLLSIIIALNQALVFVPTVKAVSSNVVISQVYAGTASGTSAKQEFIELRNNSSSPISVLGWCWEYLASSGTKQWTVCLGTTDSNTKLWLPENGSAIFISNELQSANMTSISADANFAGGMNSTKGYVRLIDDDKHEIDMVGWGDLGQYPAAAKPTDGMSLQRVSNGLGGLQDTDNDTNDFIQATPTLHSSDIYEVITVVDVCPNLPDVQQTIPSGSLLDESGDCQPDSCLNITGLQISVPDGYDADQAGTCVLHDECVNLPEIQAIIPEGMVHGDGNDCVIAYSPLELTEVMPNATGSDVGNEFIEIYNPGDEMIDLSFYYLMIGNGSDIYSFPAGTKIAPGEYKTFSDKDMKFTLVNSSSRVVLTAVGGETFGDSGSYENPKESESWALIGTVWQYTNRPTPGEANLPSIIEEASTVSGGSAPCPAGKYRNPLTNRCRNIVADAVVLGDCGDGKYRNPETNRCKSIASGAELAACKSGQYRSPETNRCRNIVSTASATLKPCKENQYRSEETNRCRNISVAAVPSAAYKVQPVKDTGSTFVGWLALGSVGLIAIGYGVWEWRQEILRILQKSFSRFHKS